MPDTVTAWEKALGVTARWWKRIDHYLWRRNAREYTDETLRDLHTQAWRNGYLAGLKAARKQSKQSTPK